MPLGTHGPREGYSPGYHPFATTNTPRDSIQDMARSVYTTDGSFRIVLGHWLDREITTDEAEVIRIFLRTE